MYRKDQIFQLIDKALAQTQGHPARVTVNSSAEGLSRIANSEIHQNVFEDRTSLTVSVYASHKVSSITTNLLSDEGIAEAVKEAIDNLELLPEGEEQPDLISEPQTLETLRFNQELADNFGVQRRAQLIADGLQGIEAPYLAFGQLSYSESAMGIGNTAGIRRYADSNQVNFNLLIADDQGGTGYASMFATEPSQVDLARTFEIALQKAKANRDPIEIEPGAYTVILEPQAVSNLLMYMLMGGFNGAMHLNKVSFLTDRIGEQVFSEKLSAVDDWSDPLSPGIAFDSDGAPRQRLNMVDHGVVKEIAYDPATAKKMGAQPTGHSISFMGGRGAIPINVVIAGGEKPLAQIIAETDKALLVTRFHYMNPVNMRQSVMTGLTRDGFFLIENGKISKAVRNMRFTENMIEAFNRIEEIASDRSAISAFMGAVCLPGMKISEFHFTGKTSFSDTQGE